MLRNSLWCVALAIVTFGVPSAALAQGPITDPNGIYGFDVDGDGFVNADPNIHGFDRDGSGLFPKQTVDIRLKLDGTPWDWGVPEIPGYPNQDPIERPRFVFSATTQPPFDKIDGREIELPVPKGEQAFIVLVVGQDIIGADGQLQIKSAAPGVRIVPIATKKAEVHPDVDSVEPFDRGFASLSKGWAKDATDWLISMDAAFVMFDVDSGVLPGAKRFVIDGEVTDFGFVGNKIVLSGVEGDWILRKGTITAQMIVARSDWKGAHHQTDVVYHHDEVKVAVKSSAPPGLDELIVHVLVDGKKAVLVGMESLVLKKGGQGDTFSSSPLRIAPTKARAKRMGGPAIVAPEYSQISLVTDFYREFVSQPTTSLMVYVTPARMQYKPAAGMTSGIKPSYLWKEALQKAANVPLPGRKTKRILEKLAGKRVDDWGELSVKEAGKITNFIITELGDRKVTVTVGHHAAMILLRRLFIEQMELYLSTLPKYKAADGRFLDLWAQMVELNAKDPTFGPGTIEVSVPHLRKKIPYADLLIKGIPDYYNSYPMRLIDLSFDWYTRASREAYLGWRQAVLDALNIAKRTKHKDLEAMVELTGQGFGPVVRMLLPRLVKLEERGTPPQLVWVPDEIARLTVQSIESVADDALAIDAIGSADTTLIIAVASLGLMAPVTIPTRIMCLAIETGMAIEAGSLVYDYFDSREAVEFALGSSVILDGHRLTAAKARAIPAWGVALAVVGTMVGLGAETYGLVASIRVAKSMKRATKLLPELEKGGLEAFGALSRDDQVTVLTAITAAKSDQKSLTLTFDANWTRRLDEYGTELQLTVTKLEDYGTVAPMAYVSRVTESLSVGAQAPRSGNAAVAAAAKQKIPNPGETFRVMGKNGPEDIVIGKFLGNGKFAQVYAIEGDSTRVIKFYRDTFNKEGKLLRTGRESVIEAERVQKLLKDRDIFQLENRHFVPDVPEGHTPYMIQDPLLDGEHIWFEYLKQERVTVVNGIPRQVKAVMGLKQAKHLTPDGKLPPEMQRAIVRLFKKLGTAKLKNGQLDPLIWEDGHMQNIFLVKEGKGYKAGILDQDRVVRFADMDTNKFVSDAAYALGYAPDSVPQVFSLVDQIKPKLWLRVTERRGSIYPSADFLMAKMLEYGGRHIKYNRTTGKFEKILIDPKIVKEFYPDLKKWVDPDLRHLGDGQSFNILPFPEIKPWVTELRIAA